LVYSINAAPDPVLAAQPLWSLPPGARATLDTVMAQWASGKVSVGTAEDADLPEHIPALPPGPAEINLPADPADNLLALFRQGDLPVTVPTPSRASLLPAERASADAVLEPPSANQPVAVPGVDTERLASPPSLPERPAAAKPEGGWRSRWLTPLAWLLPLALGAKVGKDKDDQQVNRKAKKARE
jgi:hypothetical protein